MYKIWINIIIIIWYKIKSIYKQKMPVYNAWKMKLDIRVQVYTIGKSLLQDIKTSKSQCTFKLNIHLQLEETAQYCWACHQITVYYINHHKLQIFVVYVYTVMKSCALKCNFRLIVVFNTYINGKTILVLHKFKQLCFKYFRS